MGTRIMRSLYRSPRSVSMPIFIATNSALKMDVSIVACFLDNDMISAMFIEIKNPDLDLVVDQCWNI